MNQEYQHPQAGPDRQVLNELLSQAHQNPVPDRVLVEIARLRIRYMGFLGAQDIQRDLDQVLAQWQLSEAELFQRTREIHRRSLPYPENFSKRDDWA